ncbi:Ig-like domain-containing protein [Reichenbachiella carrageenanivorans]|uniref:Ig-like domain-containing protein n=1 Tax=Reichenbachiella carrageenanivorans TaxID=2979869 RepID=A0ABY6CZ46_9BACT|nr:Ig-like domain-containing protein [Reichenbachiella carrageenanivorans]UXX79187.1 Ig-like domain-containing protein [Reichenbachiella carrageenanivorans]
MLSLLLFWGGQRAMAQNPYYDPSNNENWVLVQGLSDDFEGSAVDASKWHIQTKGGSNNRAGAWMGRPPSQYNSDNVTVQDGKLYITTKWDDNFTNWAPNYYGEAYGNPAPLTTGGLISKSQHDFTHGYMEIRCKAADAPISSSFWTTGPGGEIDCFEHYGHNPTKPYSDVKLHTSIHDWRGSNNNQSNNRKWSHDNILEFRVADDFHVYGIEWDPEYVKYHVDGHLIGMASRQEVDKTDGWSLGQDAAGGMWPAHRVWLDSEAFAWEMANSALTKSMFPDGGADFITDWVRVWQRAPGTSGALNAPINLLTNGNFENGSINGWSATGTVQAISGTATNLKGQVAGIPKPTHGDVWAGSYAAQLSGAATMEQTVTGLNPNTTYVLTCHAKSPETNEADLWYNAFVGVKGYGNVARDNMIFMPRFYQKGVVFTTGPNATSATIYVTNTGYNAAGNKNAHEKLVVVDDLILFESPDMSDPSLSVAVNSLTLSESQIEILDRNSANVSVSFLPSNATDKRIIWSSSNENVAKVSGAGLISAVGPGTATILAISQDNNSAMDQCQVTVLPNLNLLDNGDFEQGSFNGWWDNFGTYSMEDNPTHVRSGNYAAKIESLANIGQVYAVKPNTAYKVTVNAKVVNPEASKPGYYILKSYGWDAWGITIDGVSGQYNEYVTEFITAAGDGTTAVYYDTLSLWNSGSGNQVLYIDDVEIREVTDQETVLVTGISLSESSQSLEVGDNHQLTAVIAPANASNKSVTWSSSNSAVASVGANGLVSALGTGSATVTATTSEGGFAASAVVTVTAPPANTNKLNNPGFESGNASWTLNNQSSVASSNQRSGSKAGYINGNGGIEQIVTLAANTTYVLSAYGKVGGANQSFYMGLDNVANGFLENRSFNTTSYVQKSISFTTGSTNLQYKIWFWNNGGGQYYIDDVKLVAEGTSSTISVSGISIINCVSSLTVGDIEVLQAAISPANASNQGKTWSSSAPQVATVTANGQVTAVSAGMATLTVTTADGGFQSSCTVTVTEASSSGCSAPAWEAQGYAQGAQVSYNGRLYQVLWGSGTKNGGCVPGVCNGWQDLGVCSSARLADGSVEEASAVLAVVVYPNPAEDYVVVRGDDSYEFERVIIHDLYGKEILSQAYTQGELTIDTQNLKTGIYLLRIESQQQSVIQRLIIQ